MSTTETKQVLDFAGLEYYDSKIKEYIDNKNVTIDNKLGVDSLIIGEGNAEGKHSIAGGTTDTELIKSVLGGGYEELLEKYGNIANMPDWILELILSVADIGYTLEEFKRMLTISPSTAEGLLSISLGASNKSQSTAGISLGFGNISGAKGYYIYELESSGGIVLSLSQNEHSSFQSIDWEKGDRLFIVNGNRYFATVSYIDYKHGDIIVTLDEMPFTELVELKTVTIPLDGTYNITNPSERSVINLDKPESGKVEFGWGAIALGALNTILGSNAFGVGYKNLIAGDFGASFGQENEVGYSAFAVGIGNKSLGKASFTGGEKNIADGDFSASFGKNTAAKERGAFSAGGNTEAFGKYSFTSGSWTKAGDFAFASGDSTRALGDNSNSQGWNTLALGESSHIEGTSSVLKEELTKASSKNEVHNSWVAKKFSAAYGSNSHVENKNNLTLGENSHAGGLESIAGNHGSFVHGYKLSTSKDYQTVFGIRNKDNAEALFIVGNGIDKDSNAFEVISNEAGSAIKIGSTVLTEAQLKALLTLIDSSLVAAIE